MIDPFEYVSIHLGKVFLAYLIMLRFLCPFFLMFYLIFNRFLCLVSSYVTYICHSLKFFVTDPFEYLSIYLAIRNFGHASLCYAVYGLSFLMFYLIFFTIFMPNLKLCHWLYLPNFKFFCDGSFWKSFNIYLGIRHFWHAPFL